MATIPVSIHAISRPALLPLCANGLLYGSLITSSVVLFEPAPTDLLFAAAFGLLVVGRSVRVQRELPLLYAFSLGFIAANLAPLLLAEYRMEGIKSCAITLYMLMIVWTWSSLIVMQGDAFFRRSCHLFFLSAVMSSALCALAILHVLPGYEYFFLSTLKRLKGLFKDPNVFAPYMISAFFVCLAGELERGRIRTTRALAACAVALMAFLSFSRAAWLNFALTTAVFGILMVIFAERRTRKLILLAATIGLPILCAIFFVVLHAFDLLDFLGQRLQMQRYDVDRFSTQAEAVRVAFRHPLGLGPGQYSGHTSRVDIAAHNVFVKVLAENGFLGFVCFVGLLVSFMLRMVQGVLRFPAARPWFAAFLAIALATAVNSMFIDSLHWRHLFLVMGFGYGLYALKCRQAAWGASA